MRYIFLFIIFIPLQTMACAFGYVSKMRHQDLDSLISYLSTLNYGVDSSTQIWNAWVNPAYPDYDSAYQATINTVPVQSKDNYKYYTRNKCARKNTYHKKELHDIWNCDIPENRRVIDILSPPDRIDIDIKANLEEKTAEDIIEYVRNQIMNDESGRFKYMEHGGEEKISYASLDIDSMTIDPDGNYLLYLGGTGFCEIHIIKVQMLDCSENSCQYEIILNERSHLL